jgi:hypothetical protein
MSKFKVVDKGGLMDIEKATHTLEGVLEMMKGKK